MDKNTTVRPQDDLFLYVNGETLEKLEIPADRPTAGGFSELDEEVRKTMMEDFFAFKDGKKEIPDEYVRKAVKIFEKALDIDRRNAEGLAPVEPDLERILALNSIEDLNRGAKEFALDGFHLPVDCGIETDMKHTERRLFAISGPGLFLPDTTFYAEGHPAGTQMLSVYRQMATMMLDKTNLDDAKKAEILEGAFRFDASLAKIEKSREEWSEYTKAYNPYPLNKVAKALLPFDFKGFLASFYGERLPEIIMVTDPRFLKGFQGAFNESTFDDFRGWMYLKKLLSAAPYLSQELREIGGIFSKAIMGIAELESIEKQAYGLASGAFSEPVGVYYGRTYFGEEAKKDVVNMVKQIIATYKKRIAVNTFLSPKTKKKAIRKLSTMKIKMGYPDKIDPRYDRYEVRDGDSLYKAVCRISRERMLDDFEKLYVPTDRERWDMPGHMVNACYDPSNNDITFPAAILQKPFYSLKQKKEENLGGIGAVIGHEISHAFDNNGAQMDEYGNLNNWWTKEDFAQFNKLTKKMIKVFDGLPFAGGKVNGKLVVSENIADNGGMAVTLEIMSHKKNADYVAYFENWARVWCQKAKPEYQQLLLTMDVHSPAPLRANITPRSFPEWYKTFKVTPKDGMYLKPSARVNIW